MFLSDKTHIYNWFTDTFSVTLEFKPNKTEFEPRFFYSRVILRSK